MKFGFLLLILLSGMMLVTGLAQAGDVACQVDLMKPKMNNKVILDEASKPADITLEEAKKRLQLSRDSQTSDVAQTKNDQTTEEDSSTDDKEVANKTAKKSSGLGGIFDILLPSKLRDPV